MDKGTRFIWVPDSLTILRPILSVLAVAFAIRHTWAVAFWLLVVALITDALDGEAARWLQVEGKLDSYDGIADSFLTVSIILGLTLTHHLTVLAAGSMGVAFTPLAAYLVTHTEDSQQRRVVNAITRYYMAFALSFAFKYADLAYGRQAVIRFLFWFVACCAIIIYLKRGRFWELIRGLP